MARKRRRAGGGPRQVRGELNDKQRRFAQEYVVDLNATQAAIRAGYAPKSAAAQAHALLRNPKLTGLIGELKAKSAARLEITADRVLAELARVAFADIGAAFDESGALRPIHQIPEDTRRALSAIESDELREEGAAVGMTRKVKLADKLRGLEILAKHLKLLNDAPDPAKLGNVTVIVRGAGVDAEQPEPPAHG